MPNLYLCINSTKIGGAEKRSLRMANALSEAPGDFKIHYVLPGMLWETMNASRELALILANPRISFLSYDQGDELTTKRENGRLMRLYQKRKYFPRFLQVWLIKKYSQRFYSFIRERLQPGDIYHHFFGFTGLAAGLRLKDQVSLSICELTSPVYGPVVCHYWSLFNGATRERLRLIAVTEVIFAQVQEYISGNHRYQAWMDSHLKKYPKPFLPPAPSIEPEKKENLIIFASNFFERKNPVLFSQAIVELFEKGLMEGWRVFIRGMGPLEGEIRDILKPYLEAGRAEIGFSHDLGEELMRSKVYVSIIETGNYPSQSAFEAYARGNILLLSDRGNTREKFTHPSFQIVELDLEPVKRGLLNCVAIAEKEGYNALSASVRAHYTEQYDHRKILDWLGAIHQGG